MQNCVEKLRERLRKAMAWMASRIDQVRDGRARNTARKHADRFLTRVIHGVVFPQMGLMVL
jgi:hypothetical protein